MQGTLEMPGRAALRRADGRIVSEAADLAAMLRRERARADRSGSEFCVILLGMRGRQGGASGARLADVIARRARETDEVAVVAGWLACAVLPDTPPAGGRRFADDVRASLNGGANRAVLEVLSYPSAPPEGVTDDGNGVAGAAFDVDGDDGPGARFLLSTFFRYVAPGASFRRHECPPLDVIFAVPLPAWKRAMDVAIGGVALACLSPLMLLVAAGIWLGSGRPVIFKQRRAGLLGRPFNIYKFRTMVVDAEARQAELRDRSEQDGPAFKLTNDPRVTRLGHFLRKTSLDELPQLWNVLKGDMSLVGPRPLPCGEASECSGWHRRRLDVTPGITCIWQVKGRSRVSFQEWMRMDATYVRTRRLLRDVSLLLMTIPAVLLRRGAR